MFLDVRSSMAGFLAAHGQSFTCTYGQVGYALHQRVC